MVEYLSKTLKIVYYCFAIQGSCNKFQAALVFWLWLSPKRKFEVTFAIAHAIENLLTETMTEDQLILAKGTTFTECSY